MNGSSRAADLIRQVDWTAHPLGGPEGWSAALRITLGTVLSSPESMFLIWGPDRSFFFNDAYIPILGPRLPHAMGAPFAEIWADGWEQVRTIVGRALTGEASRFEDLPVTISRYGEPERTWWTVSYSPVADETGTVAGMLSVCIETTARVVGEERLREVEGRNRQIIDSATEYAIVATTADGRVTRWNEGARRLLGWSESEMLGERVHQGFTPEDVAVGIVEAEMRAALVNGAAPDERWHLRKDGSRFWGSGRMTVLRDGAGEAAGFVKVFRDRTVERQEEEALRVAEGRLALALEIAALGTFEWHTETGIVALDGRARDIFGLPPDGEVRADEILGLVERADSERIAMATRTAADAGTPIEATYWITLPSGERRHIVSTGRFVPEPEGPPVRILGVFRDITEAKRLEDALQGANQQLRSDVTQRTAERDRLWDASPDLLLVWAPDGTIHATNPAWTTLLGYAPGELIGRIGLEIVHPDDLETSRQALFQSITERLSTFENRIRHKDGTYRDIAWVAAPGDGLVYGTGRDVTAEKHAAEALRQAEEQLRQSQKVEAVGQLTGGVAHDFNNLLTVIRGSVDLLRRPGLSEERRLRYVEAISDTADRAKNLTSQLLAFARRQALRPVVFDAGKSVTNLGDMLRSLTGSRIEVTIVDTDGPCPVDADPSQFDTAIVNMAVNARDAMNGSGRLAVAVREVSEMPAMRSHPAVSGLFVAVSLTDSGCGIDPGQIDRIFEPFFTTKSVGHGTGLGLSQVFGFAKQSGGEIGVLSRPGEGATFTLYLPRAAAPLVSAAAESEDLGETSGQGARILIVEDNADVGRFAAEALRELGYELELAGDAGQALTLLATDGGRFEAVFSDVMMPGMSGIELGQEIRRLYADLPVVLTSGYSTVLAQNGTYGFELLHKPYSIDELSHILRKAMRWRSKVRCASTLPNIASS